MVQGCRRLTPIYAQFRLQAGFGLGKGNLCSAGGTGSAADSGVASGMGRQRVRAFPTAILSGFGLRDQMGPLGTGGRGLKAAP